MRQADAIVAYRCTRRNFSGEDYAVLAVFACSIGASLPDAYEFPYTCGDISDYVGHVLFQRTLMAVKQPPVVSVAVSESTKTQSTMVACAHYLNHLMEPTTNFWVAL